MLIGGSGGTGENEFEFDGYRVQRRGEIVTICGHSVELVTHRSNDRLISLMTYKIGPFIYRYQDLKIKIPGLTVIDYDKKGNATCKFIEYGCDTDVIVKKSVTKPLFPLTKYYEYAENVNIKVDWFTALFMESLGQRYVDTDRLANSLWERYKSSSLLPPSSPSPAPSQ